MVNNYLNIIYLLKRLLSSCKLSLKYIENLLFSLHNVDVVFDCAILVFCRRVLLDLVLLELSWTTSLLPFYRLRKIEGNQEFGSFCTFIFFFTAARA